MNTPRECAAAGIKQPHWLEDARRLGLDGKVVAGVDDLITDVAHEIEKRDVEWREIVENTRRDVQLLNQVPVAPVTAKPPAPPPTLFGVPPAAGKIPVCPKCGFPQEFGTHCASPFHVIGR
jgi:hypothetical protein